MARHWRHLAWSLTEHDSDVRAPIRQPPGSDQRPAAIAATAGEGEDRATARIILAETGDVMIEPRPMLQRP